MFEVLWKYKWFEVLIEIKLKDTQLTQLYNK